MGDTMSSLLLGGLTSGTIELKPADVAGTNVINVPARTGTMVTTGDVGTVTKTMLAGSSEFGLPVGAVIHVAMTSAPSGYLKANGDAVSRTTYADLFAAIGTTFGSGDGSTTFNLPDLRGEFVRGWDDSRGVDTSRIMGTSQKGTYYSFDLNRDGVWSTSAQNTSVLNARLQVGVDGYVTSDYSTLQSTGVGPSVIRSLPPVDGNQFADGIMRPRNVALLACIKF
jgi:phage-related tail fiber protein